MSGQDISLRRTTTRTFVVSTAAVLLVMLAAAMGNAKDLTPTLHPQAAPLPFTHQGPFVTAGDGGVLCVDAQHALHSGDEGRTWTATPIFRDEQKYRISDERALLRTRDGVVVAAWMNTKELKSPPGWNWGAKDADWQDFVLPIYVCRSLDEGKTWEEPVFLNKPWCGCIHSLIETQSGRLVLVGQEIIPAWRHATVVFVSEDQGRTWQRSNVLDIGQGQHDHAGSIEGTVIERQDGSLYQLLRTETGWLYEAVSRNGGLLWEDFRAVADQVRDVLRKWGGWRTGGSPCCGIIRRDTVRTAAAAGRSCPSPFRRTTAPRGRRRGSSRRATAPVAGFPIRICTSASPASCGSPRCKAACG